MASLVPGVNASTIPVPVLKPPTVPGVAASATLVSNHAARPAD